MQLFVQTLTGETIALRGCVCLRDVRRQISTRLHVDPDAQVLCFNGKPLTTLGNPTLGDVGIGDMSTIRLSARLVGGHGPNDRHDVSSDDHYRVLGVGRQSSDGEIAKAYRALALKYHPDRNPGSTTAEEHFKRISLAYDTLKDKAKRAHYDQFGRDVPVNGQSSPSPTHRSCRGPPSRTTREHFTYADASDVFRSFFGSADPFAAFEMMAGADGPPHGRLHERRATAAPDYTDDQAQATGRMVRVVGLVRDTTHNGMVGQIVRREPHNRRFVVRMLRSNATVALQSPNVSPLVAAVVCGLQARAELNGRSAYISERTSGGRYVVYIPPMTTPLGVQLGRLRLSIGTRVVLHDLTNVQYNGLRGRVVDAAHDGSKYTVEASTRARLKVKPANLHVELGDR